MPILTPVVKLVIFRQSIRPHSAIAFLVEFLCFVLELLGKEKELSKIFGIACACDTLIFTLLDIVKRLYEDEVTWGKWGYIFWFYTKNGHLYWNFLDAYLFVLSMVHLTGSIVSYIVHKHYLVLIPLLAAGLELVPQEAYQVLKNNGVTELTTGQAQTQYVEEPRSPPLQLHDPIIQEAQIICGPSLQDEL